MARPRSIYERKTTSALPPPELREGSHVVAQGESLMSISVREYDLEEYNPDLWREVGLLNKVENPFTFDSDFRGVRLRIPPRPLPDFLD
jgi:hypothetical protein